MPKILKNEEYEKLLAELEAAKKAAAETKARADAAEKRADAAEVRADAAEKRADAAEEAAEEANVRAEKAEKRADAAEIAAAGAKTDAEKARYAAMSEFERAAHDHPDLYDWLKPTVTKAYQYTSRVVCFLDESGPFFDRNGVHRTLQETNLDNETLIGQNVSNLREGYKQLRGIFMTSPTSARKRFDLDIQDRYVTYRDGDQSVPIVSTQLVTKTLATRPQCIVAVPDYMFTSGAILDVLSALKKHYKTTDGKVSDEELAAFATIVNGCKEKVKEIAASLKKEADNFKKLANEGEVAPQDKELEGLEKVQEELGKM